MRIKSTWGIGDGGGTGVLFNALAVSDTADHDSQVIDLSEMDGMGIQLITTGTLTGTWKLLGSLNYSDGSGRDTSAAAGTFNDLSSFLTPNISQPAGSATDQYTQLGGGTSQGLTTFFGKFVKLRFTRASGTGSISAYVLAKSVGS